MLNQRALARMEALLEGVTVYRPATLRERWRARRATHRQYARLPFEDAECLVPGWVGVMEVWGRDGCATRKVYFRVVRQGEGWVDVALLGGA